MNITDATFLINHNILILNVVLFATYLTRVK